MAKGRALERPDTSGIMTGSATVCSMGLTDTGEGRGGGCMTTGTVDCYRDKGRISHDLGGVIKVMAVEVSTVAGDTVSTLTAVDRGIAVVIGANDASASGVGVAGEAIVLMYRDDGIATMAIHAERVGGDGS